MRMTASVGFMTLGMSRSTKRTSRGPKRTAPLMACLLMAAETRNMRAVYAKHQVLRAGVSLDRAGPRLGQALAALTGVSAQPGGEVVLWFLRARRRASCSGRIFSTSTRQAGSESVPFGPLSVAWIADC